MPDPTTSQPHPIGIGRLAIAITEPERGVAVLSVRGEIDALTTPQLETALHQLFGQPAHRFVIDLSDVTFLASSGLALLIRAAQLAEERGSRLGLVCVSRAVQRPLQITGSERLFDVFSTLDAACEGSV